MRLRALWALMWLTLTCVPGAGAAALRDNLYGVKALSPTEAWAVGNFGAIYHTANGGKSWEARDSGTKSPLFGIDFADAQQGWAVGKSAEILATSDGGRTWKAQTSPIPPSKHLFKVAALTPRLAWAVGDWGAIAVTTDGGRTWQDRSLPKLKIVTSDRPDRQEKLVLEDVVLYDLSWPDAQHGFIAGEFATLLATSDGGETWEKRALPTDKTIFGIHFVTPDEGWAVGIDGLVLHTTDAGRTWEVQHGNPHPATIDELAFTDALKNPGMYAVSVVGQEGIVVGDTGTVLVSSDGGRTWARRVLPERDRFSWLRDVSLVAGARGVVVGAKGLSGLVEGGDVTLSDGGKAVPATD
ncbi:MAG: YCF48-related protein [Candidatus Binatia bacterium]